MDYEYRRPQSFYGDYWMNARNATMSMAQFSRPDPRVYPMGGPSLRTRSVVGREDAGPDTSPTRRRIAVACARCRKRKIRCSGEPGDGSGCQNCKQAGVPHTDCAFYRVGSDEPNKVRNAYLQHGIHNPPMPFYTYTEKGVYARPQSAAVQYPGHIDTRATAYPQHWTIPGAEDTSPVEAYGLDQTVAYLPNANNLASVYGQGYGYDQKPAQSNAFLNQPSSASYTANGLPCVNTTIAQTSIAQAAVATEAISPLNLTSMQSMLPMTLPQRPRQRQGQIDATAPKRQLPIPQPSPAQVTRNTVDLQQDQRLRSIKHGKVSSYNGSQTKPSWDLSSNKPDGTVSTGSAETPSTNLMLPGTTVISNATTAESMASYNAIASTDITGVLTTSAPELHFNTSLLLDAMPASTTTTAYSNFRGYAPPSTTDSVPSMSRQASQANLYSFSPESTTKKRSFGNPSTEAELVSGQRYAPLAHPQLQQAQNMERSRSMISGSVPLQRASNSNLNSNV